MATAKGAHAEEAGSGFSTRIFLLCTSNILMSATLVRFNKHLMQQDRFPFATVLVGFHMCFSLVASLVLHRLAPSLFEGMPTTRMARLQLMRYLIPIGMAFSIVLYTSNEAYRYCNVSFLQYMKEGNVLLCFFFSCAVGLQTCDAAKLVSLTVILCGCALASGSEISFVWRGFFLQLASQIADVCRITAGQMVLNGELKVGPLTYTLHMAPISLVAITLAAGFTWTPEVTVRVQEHWRMLLLNSCLAFGLNVACAVVLKETSALTYMLMGVVKDILIVIVSTTEFGEPMNFKQVVGFSIALGGVAWWSYMRSYPSSEAVRSFEAALCMAPAAADEIMPISIKSKELASKVEQ